MSAEFLEQPEFCPHAISPQYPQPCQSAPFQSMPLVSFTLLSPVPMCVCVCVCVCVRARTRVCVIIKKTHQIFSGLKLVSIFSQNETVLIFSHPAVPCLTGSKTISDDLLLSLYDV